LHDLLSVPSIRQHAQSLNFRDCASKYIDAHRESWKNQKHAAQWESALTTYAYPFIGEMMVSEIDTHDIMKVLEPIWKIKTETASRLRGRMESILSWATVNRYRSGENPARWKGHLDQLLAKRSRLQKVQHHAALPYNRISEFVRAMQAQEGTAALALRFAILTACRTNEVIGATRSEIDSESAIWTIPPERMKAGREHRIPFPMPRWLS